MKFRALSLLLTLCLSLFGASLAYAEETDGTEETEAISETEATCVDYGCGGGGYYDPGMYLNVWTTVSAKATEVYFYASYEVSGQSSKTSATTKLQSEYVSIKNKLQSYGTVKRTGMYTYSDWYDPSKYAGSLSITVELNNVKDYAMVEDILYTESFSPWADIRVENLADAEADAAEELRDLLDQEEETYETILGYALGAISSLSLYSWVDSTSFDAETRMVDVTVSADAWYYAE